MQAYYKYWLIPIHEVRDPFILQIMLPTHVVKDAGTLQISNAIMLLILIQKKKKLYLTVYYVSEPREE